MKQETDLADFNFEIFRRQLALILEAREDVCQLFAVEISNAKDIDEIENLFKREKERIGDWLGIDTDKECDECADMEGQVEELRDELEQYKDLQLSVADEYKFKAFAEAKDNYSVEELEYLFSNGRRLIDEIKNDD